ncbi:MAG: diaminopimelate epimerase [Saprospiraceae bacterium]|nr:diaminopimelate epimerase [Saprospiraceae bacterium]
MEIPFYKYQGTGNDFIIIDQMTTKWVDPGESIWIQSACDRKFGIGADGLILLSPSEQYDFYMHYFNADGKIGSLCGNGSRCAVEYLFRKGYIQSDCIFEASDGLHRAIASTGYVELEMRPVDFVDQGKDHFVLDTGSPHYVTFVEDLGDLDIVQSGRAIRYSGPFRDEGINVNFVEASDREIEVRTYERGVEDETLSCGTGVTASALAYALRKNEMLTEIRVHTKGGQLKIRFQQHDHSFQDIWLCGPVAEVFQGTIQKD